jgi:hypothetical protein
LNTIVNKKAHMQIKNTYNTVNNIREVYVSKPISVQVGRFNVSDSKDE